MRLPLELRAGARQPRRAAGRARSARCASSRSASCSASASASSSASAGMRASRWVYLPATAFVEFFRNTPVLVQILWFYYALPILLPFQISPLTAAALGISLNSAAFSAEIYRGGIESIDRGQAEAARALGMTAAQAMRRIVLPQALRAHAARAHQPRHRDLQDDDARLGGGLRRAAAAGQAARLAELQPDRDLHRDRRRLLPVPVSAGAGDLCAGAAARPSDA